MAGAWDCSRVQAIERLIMETDETPAIVRIVLENLGATMKAGHSEASTRLRSLEKPRPVITSGLLLCKLLSVAIVNHAMSDILKSLRYYISEGLDIICSYISLVRGHSKRRSNSEGVSPNCRAIEQ